MRWRRVVIENQGPAEPRAEAGGGPAAGPRQPRKKRLAQVGATYHSSLRQAAVCCGASYILEDQGIIRHCPDQAPARLHRSPVRDYVTESETASLNHFRSSRLRPGGIQPPASLVAARPGPSGIRRQIRSPMPAPAPCEFNPARKS